ncbi:myb-related protein 1-like isoform X1 [Typha latifolia]|uniref:myb-related protein 1-like isoform X1 n=2 Tax=Typha latifolia TaxID=4733 RepID=UPI003C2F34DF
MDSQEMHNQDCNQVLVLSVDAKPRLRWTQQLHERFIYAVSQLGGADKATPKSVMRVMGIPGLTLYHLKSHLQKYRLAKNREPNLESSSAHSDETKQLWQFNGNILETQMEVQRKLQQRIEVQRHLQLRIEAQGKYLQSVLRKAQETLAEYDVNSTGIEHAMAELSELVTAVETENQSSTDSCLTSSEKLERGNDGKPEKLDSNSSSNNESLGHDESKGSCSSIYGGRGQERPTIGKRVHEELDLNR